MVAVIECNAIFFYENKTRNARCSHSLYWQQRPWPEYDSSVQIMFRVGMGQSPSVPSSLSEEGHDFLAACFVHDRKNRATVAQLLDHTFVKVRTICLPLAL